MTTGRTLDGVIAPESNRKLFGHEAAENFLAEAYRSGRMHHAVLIEGREGIGKATLAFRFARHVLTYPEQNAAPSTLLDAHEETPIHRQVGQGASHHLVQLKRPVDEKTGKVRSAITVDEIRRAGRLFTQTSGTGSWRIVIIDPADDMNHAAANAILKMLEEPPERSLFLVVSHVPGRLLATIRSRCLRVRLTPLSAASMENALSQQPMTAKLEAADRDRVIARAEGSVARALMIVNYGGLDLIDAFNTILREGPDASAQMLHKLADSLTGRDREEIFAFFVSHVEDWITSHASEAARAGDVTAAARFATLATKVTRELKTTEEYNLDRKQSILSLLQGIFSPPLP